MNLMEPLDLITYLIGSINIHLVKVIHAARDLRKKTESVYYVLEVAIKKLRVIILAPNETLEQQILTLVQMTRSFESYAK